MLAKQNIGDWVKMGIEALLLVLCVAFGVGAILNRLLDTRRFG
jgi:hypothetical protein